VVSVLEQKYSFTRAFPVSEYQSRVRKARELMAKNGIDALLLTQRVNVEYFSGALNTLWGCLDRPFSLILPRDGEPALVIPRLLECVTARTTWIKDIRCYPSSPPKDAERIVCPAMIASTVEDLGLGKAVIGTEAGYDLRLNMALREFEAVKGGVPDAKFVDAYDVIWGCRIFKSNAEIERIRKASTMTCNALKRVYESHLKEGMTEADYAREVAKAFLEEEGEARDVGFVYVGVMNDPWLGPMIDRAPTDRKLKSGDMLIADIGAAFGGYTSDMTRWAVIGKSSGKMKELHDLAAQSTTAVNEATRPGIPICDLVKAANAPLEKAGYPMAIARIGHGLGLDVHEPPSLGKENTTLTQPGMIFTIEPCLQYNEFIIWVEDAIVITEKGYENLTPMAKNLYEVR